MWHQTSIQKMALLALSSYTLFMLGCGFNNPRVNAANNAPSASSAFSGSNNAGNSGSQTGGGQIAGKTGGNGGENEGGNAGGNAGGGNAGGGNAGGGNSGGGNAGGGQTGGGNSGGNGGNSGGNAGGGQNGGNGGGNAGAGDDHGGGGSGSGGGKHGGGGDDAGNGGAERKLASLKTVSIPGPSAQELSNIVLDKQAALVLGKAFFWDMQFGSDGVTACATCHFTAGSDNRWINQINPGFRRVDGNGNPSPDSNTFQSPLGPNHQLTAADFPLHKLSDPNNPNSGVSSDNNNIVGSQGVYRYDFNDVVMGQAEENETAVADSVFHVGSTNTRRSTPRNAPSAVNAVFNYRNFWDGRAQGTFNGVNPFGKGDPNAFLLQADAGSPNGIKHVKLALSNSSLASQAVGPPGSDVEMSAAGRPFVKMGKKMLSLMPLAKQDVAADDSVLGFISAAPNHGLSVSYLELVRAAFQPQYWQSNAVVDATGNFLHTGTPQNTNEYTLAEFNFSMFWGVAVQMYESTLVSDNSRFDQFMEGNRNALTALEQRGLDRFTGKGGCSNCHNGAELTDAAVSNVASRGVVEVLPGGRWHDVGFHNIGVRPTTDDLGIGTGDPSGLASLSVADMASQGLVNGTAVPAGAPVSVRGAVKTPGLRNIELTGPYFVNGGQATLSQVVDFYSRGGDFRSADVDPLLERAGFSSDDKAAVVAFLKSLTDERVRAQSAPFDHPSLTLGNGMAMVNGVWQEQTITVPATGQGGGAALPKFCQSIGASCD
jgi:cytochrome c peroxidase